LIDGHNQHDAHVRCEQPWENKRKRNDSDGRFVERREYVTDQMTRNARYVREQNDAFGNNKGFDERETYEIDPLESCCSRKALFGSAVDMNFGIATLL